MKRPSRGNLLSRALTSSIAGLPISYVLNVVVSVPVTVWMISNNYDAFSISAVLSVPFFVASAARMYTIDWAWFKYHINIEPKYLIHKLYHHFKYWYSLTKCHEASGRDKGRPPSPSRRTPKISRETKSDVADTGTTISNRENSTDNKI